MQSSPHAASMRLSSSEFARWNQTNHAFVSSDWQQSAPDGDNSGSLGGVTVGVKDIIDVAGFPTRNGSQTCREAGPAEEDASVVRALRAAGARIVGKTTTTEFAFTDPTACRNPHDLSRSPGGSSSGSGAAVGAGMVDMALGTQTAGSLIRPAAYCGAVGFKPSYGTLPTCGVTPLAPSFDTVGIIARSVDLAERAFAVMQTERAPSPSCHHGTFVMTAFLWDTTTDVAPETFSAFEEADKMLAELCHRAPPPEVPVDIAGVVSDHLIVMNRESFDAHGHILADGRAHLLQPKFRAGLEAGHAVKPDEASAARARLARARDRFWETMDGIDVILTLPVPDGAPLMDGTTGFQHWLTPWTVFGGPLACLPWGLDVFRRPRSVMLAGRPGADTALLDAARALEVRAPDMPLPSLPD